MKPESRTTLFSPPPLKEVIIIPRLKVHAIHFRPQEFCLLLCHSCGRINICTVPNNNSENEFVILTASMSLSSPVVCVEYKYA